MYMVDPQGRHIWIKTFINLPDDFRKDEPLGLFISVKGSSVSYVNGMKISENGWPADLKSHEIAGKMDRNYALPSPLLRSGNNEIILRASSHRGYLNLVAPIHLVGIDKFQNTQDFILRNYWPTLLPFGALVLGGFYFLVMTFRGRTPLQSALLFLMSFASAAQLFIEVSRGLIAYTYPFQDLRLIGIWICAAIFGVSLSSYVISYFQLRHRLKLIGVSAALVLVSLIVGGMDTKTSLVFLLPSVFVICLTVHHAMKGTAHAWGFTAALLIFASANIFTSGQFLDVFFYYIVLALLVFLFAQQAMAFTQEQILLTKEFERSERLQMALDSKNSETEGFKLQISSAGKIRLIDTREIAHIDGAGDYSDIVLATGKTYLHSSTLSALEERLPHQFLRVHRSHIVNTDFIETLTRDPSGTGTLKLNTGDAVPVSRRIMPKVRRAALSHEVARQI